MSDKNFFSSEVVFNIFLPAYVFILDFLFSENVVAHLINLKYEKNMFAFLVNLVNSKYDKLTFSSKPNGQTNKSIVSKLLFYITSFRQ